MPKFTNQDIVYSANQFYPVITTRVTNMRLIGSIRAKLAAKNIADAYIQAATILQEEVGYEFRDISVIGQNEGPFAVIANIYEPIIPPSGFNETL